MASETDDDGVSRDSGDKGREHKQNLAPFDWQTGRRSPENDPVVYSLPARKLLTGDISDDIPENVKVVRIFTSSTFTGKYMHYHSAQASIPI